MSIFNDTIKQFIRNHENDDVHNLALQKWPDDNWPKADILDQIKARQKARNKLAHWYACDDIIFPPTDLVEQASSTATAKFKASLVKGTHFVDLTGGVGIDSAALADRFTRGVVVERHAEAADLLRHNLPLVTQTPLKILTAQAEDVLQNMDLVDFIYIDPQRRNAQQKGLKSFHDLEPDILGLLPIILKKAQQIMIKASPMLDISLACSQLSHVTHVYVVEWQKSCREVLYILDQSSDTKPEIHSVILDDDGCSIHEIMQQSDTSPQYVSPLRYLYEPSPAMQKGDMVATLGAQYDMAQLHPSTMLLTSDVKHNNFPGRIFEIKQALHTDKKTVQKAMPNKKCNMIVRNFPSTPEALMKKLGLKDGGNDYLIACTLHDNTHTLLWCARHD